MNTNMVWFIVAVLGMSALMWNMAGMDDVLSGPDPAGDLQSGDELEEKAPGTPELNGSADSSAGEGDIVGVIISGGQGITDFIGMLVLLPVELQRLGFPQWFAYPLGRVIQIIGVIGLYQFVTNRVMK